MNVTAQILFYLFSIRNRVLSESVSSPDNIITSIKRIQTEEAPDGNALYVITAADLETPGDFDALCNNFFIISPTGKLPGRKVLKKLKGRNYAVTDAFYTTYELQNTLLRLFYDFLRQENELLLATLSQDRIDDVLSFGHIWFPWEYSVVDIDMRLIFSTDDFHKLLGEEKVNRIPADSIQSLILSKEFHEAAKKTSPFYQAMAFSNLTALARNILPDGKYAGRVVMFLDEETDRVPKGAEELFEFYTDCITEALLRAGRLSTRPQNDPLRKLCISLYNREPLPEYGIRDVLSRTGWEKEHDYCVITFRFLPDTAWEAQLETTLPYLADELENEWEFSCAINTGHEIHMVLNLTLSGVGRDLSVLHQQFAYFVREHICVAGLSPVFRDFSDLENARVCADAALRIGQEKHPHFWYYLFDNYRLDFIKETLVNTVSPGFLMHPAPGLLKDYDRANHSDLSATLKAYLDNDRNMTSAADAIFVHRTTFCRRMDHIRKLTGLDLDDPNTLILLELSYQFMEQK